MQQGRRKHDVSELCPNRVGVNAENPAGVQTTIAVLKPFVAELVWPGIDDSTVRLCQYLFRGCKPRTQRRDRFHIQPLPVADSSAGAPIAVDSKVEFQPNAAQQDG